MPRSPCLSVSSEIKEWDESLRQKFLIPEEKAELKARIVALTESTAGIALLSLLLVFLALLVWKPKHSSPAFYGNRAVQLILGLLASNETSDLLKFLLGRLKPHVTFYNPVVVPALSFPSSHAFNTTFLCVFLYLSVVNSPDFEPRVQKATTLLSVFLAVYALAIVLSRIAVGQHYPIDVAAGTLFGATFAYLYQFALSKFWRFGPAKSTP